MPRSRPSRIALSLALAACSSAAPKAGPTRCAEDDVECWQAALAVAEGGVALALTAVPVALVDAPPPAPTPSGPFTVWASGLGGVVAWDGHRWLPEEIPPLPEVGTLAAISGTSAEDIWVAGADVGLGIVVFFLHRTAAGWQWVESPGDQMPRDVFAAAPDDAWAVGFHGLVLHWDGGSWTTVDVGSTDTFNKVWTDGSEVWIAGETQLLHRSGGTWSVAESAGATVLVAFAADDVWFGGRTWRRWAGASLEPIAAPPGAGWVYDAWGSPSALWASGTSAGGDTMYLFDGQGWSTVPRPVSPPLVGGLQTSSAITSLWGSGPADVWGMGDLTGGPGSEAFHWDGAAWTALPLPGVYYDVWGDGTPSVVPPVDPALPHLVGTPPPVSFPERGASADVVLDYTDNHQCRPSICFRVCSGSDRSICAGSYLCTPAALDGAWAGSLAWALSFSTEPAAPSQQLAIAVRPLSAPDCAPLTHLTVPGRTTDVGEPVIVTAIAVGPPPPPPPGGGGGGGGGTVGSWDGTYQAAIHTQTPAGGSDSSGTFACASGVCSDASGWFAGTVNASGAFTGSFKICGACEPLPMSGTFAASGTFVLSGASGSVSATVTAHRL